MAAAENGHSDAAKLLLERGANVNARDNRGRVALMEAVAAGHDDTVKLLLRWNADVNAVDASGMTSLGESRRRNYTQITHLLQNAGAWR
jgi:ankyrin repeat protein